MNSDKRLRRKVRNSYIISTVSVAMVLFLLGSVGYLIMGALGVTDRIREGVSVFVMLNDEVDDAKRGELEDRLRRSDAVREVLFTSKDAAIEEYIHFGGDDFRGFLDVNPLPASFEVKFRADGPESPDLKAFERMVSGWEGVHEVVYQREVAEQVGSNTTVVNILLMLFGGTLLVISLILLNNTIRVTVFSKRYVISTMKLVGATKGFIMKPFLSSAVMQGIYAALIAVAMFAVMLWGLHEGLPEVRLADDRFELMWIAGGMLAAGVFISLVFTIFAVNKFIKLPTRAIYYY